MGDVRRYLSLLASTQDALVELGKMNHDPATEGVIATVIDLRAVLLERICDDGVMREAGGMYAMAAASSVAADRPE